MKREPKLSYPDDDEVRAAASHDDLVEELEEAGFDLVGKTFDSVEEMFDDLDKSDENEHSHPGSDLAVQVAFSHNEYVKGDRLLVADTAENRKKIANGAYILESE